MKVLCFVSTFVKKWFVVREVISNYRRAHNKCIWEGAEWATTENEHGKTPSSRPWAGLRSTWERILHGTRHTISHRQRIPRAELRLYPLFNKTCQKTAYFLADNSNFEKSSSSQNGSQTTFTDSQSPVISYFLPDGPRILLLVSKISPAKECLA